VPRSDLAAVIPAYDCDATIAQVVTGAGHWLSEVIVVDDGSRDRTAERAAAAGAHVISLPQNRGKGAALRIGIEHALALGVAAVVLLDGDGQHDPADLPALIGAWDAGRYDLIVGSRLQDARQIPKARYWTNYIGSRILSWMTGYELQDSQSGYRVLASGLLRRLRLCADDYAIESEMLLKAGRLSARLGHVPVRTIYEGQPSHFRPFADTVRIALASIRHKVDDAP